MQVMKNACLLVMQFTSYSKFVFCYLFLISIRTYGYSVETQDLVTSRANTLSDDADDIQRQLDNEAKDRMKYGKQKITWVFNFPTHYSGSGFSTKMYRNSRGTDLLKSREADATAACLDPKIADITHWDYKVIRYFDAVACAMITDTLKDAEKTISHDQSKWILNYPACSGRAQSPISLPYRNLLKVERARPLMFFNHRQLPTSLSMFNDGQNVRLTGSWQAAKRPLIFGGAVHSRRYLFDSITLRWPSEHMIGGIQYPVESQALYVSAEYGSVEEALRATSDKMALLGVVNLYKFADHTQRGLKELFTHIITANYGNNHVNSHPMSYFSPPFKEYVCYHGSLTIPPCTETVFWIVRARALPVSRELVKAVQEKSVDGESHQFMYRQAQPLNDRTVYFFD